MEPPVYINGRFLSQPITGVQRFAREVVGALYDLSQGATSIGAGRIVLLVPSNASLDSATDTFPMRAVGRLTGHAWEQVELPFFARDGILLNLCNTGPIVKRRQLVVVHDAAVFAVPGAYSAGFRWWYRIMLHLVGRVASQLATVSKFSQSELSHYLNVPAARFHVLTESGEHILRLTPDDGLMSRYDLGRRPFVLAVGSLSPHKNFRAVVRAIELMDEVDCEFVIAGGVSPRVFASEPSVITSKIKHIGYVSDRELRTLYERAACLVYPSLYEGFGLPPLEAMACGCPVVASQAASIREVCGTAALYCDPLNPSDIALRVKELLATESLKEDLRRRGRARAAEFSWVASARQIAELVGLASGSTTSSVEPVGGTDRP